MIKTVLPALIIILFENKNETNAMIVSNRVPNPSKINVKEKRLNYKICEPNLENWTFMWIVVAQIIESNHYEMIVTEIVWKMNGLRREIIVLEGERNSDHTMYFMLFRMLLAINSNDLICERYSFQNQKMRNKCDGKIEKRSEG